MFPNLRRALRRPSDDAAASTAVGEDGVDNNKGGDKDEARGSGCTGLFWRRGRGVVPAAVEDKAPDSLPSQSSATNVPIDANVPEIHEANDSPQLSSILRTSLKPSVARTDLIHFDPHKIDAFDESSETTIPKGLALPNEVAAANRAHVGLGETSKTSAEIGSEGEASDEPVSRTGQKISWAVEESVCYIPEREQPRDQPRSSQPEEADIANLCCCCMIPYPGYLMRSSARARRSLQIFQKRGSGKRRSVPTKTI